MNNFITVFLPQVWPLFVFVGLCIVLMVVLTAQMRRTRQKQRDRKKDGSMDSPRMRSRPAPIDNDSVDDLSLAEADAFDDDDLLADVIPANTYPLDGDDPLAELYQARMEAESEEEETSLSALLSDVKDEPIHMLTEEPVKVQLNTGDSVDAQEMMGILRDATDERLMILIGATAYRSLTDAPEAKKQFTRLMKELSTVILKPDTRPEEQAQGEEEDELVSLLSGLSEETIHTLAEGQVKVQLSTGDTADATEMLSILRDTSDERLMVLFGDTVYRSLTDAPEAKKQFTRLMKELSAIILKPDTRSERTVEAAPAQAVNADSDAVVETGEATKEQDDGEQLPGDLPDMTLPDDPDNYELGRFGRVKIKRIDKAPELNISEAIEAYLQYKIEQNPQYQRRGIHIKPALHGGVRIDADGKSYDFVDEVEDSDVRTFIQAAINEWQERH